MTQGIEFDPGFAPYIMAFEGAINVLYTDINRFKNLSQKKMRFRQYYKKILQIFHNNLGFYIGCLMWAAYIKTQDEQDIINNHCFGREYNEDENTSEVDFLIQFTELFPKDMNYYLSEKFQFDNKEIEILKAYKEFLIINRGFVDSKKNTDIKLPACIVQDDAISYRDKIYDILSVGDLTEFMEYKDLIIK